MKKPCTHRKLNKPYLWEKMGKYRHLFSAQTILQEYYNPVMARCSRCGLTIAEIIWPELDQNMREIITITKSKGADGRST